jgi:hypothetical protein
MVPQTESVMNSPHSFFAAILLIDLLLNLAISLFESRENAGALCRTDRHMAHMLGRAVHFSRDTCINAIELAHAAQVGKEVGTFSDVHNGSELSRKRSFFSCTGTLFPHQLFAKRMARAVDASEDDS